MEQMIRGTRHGILIAIAILAAFVFFLFAIVLSYETTFDAKVMSTAISPLVKYQLYFMVSLAALGVAVGATVFYFMSQRVENTQGVAKKSAEIVLKFLSADEQKVLKALLASHGGLYQSALSREHGLSKVKAHRVVAKLAEKGIVTVEGYGKTNTLRLQPEIAAALKE